MQNRECQPTGVGQWRLGCVALWVPNKGPSKNVLEQWSKTSKGKKGRGREKVEKNFED